MSTSTVDLSNLQQVNFGNGVTGSYDPSSGNYYDSGGNVLSASDLSQYGSFSVGSPGGGNAPSPSGAATPPPVNSSGNGAALAGLSGLFSSIGGAIVNASRPPVLNTAGGQALVYNPATGTYEQAGLSTTGINPIILLLLAAGLIYLVFREA